MKLQTIQKVIGGVLGAAVLLSIPACTDDHYDIKVGDTSAANTLWQNIEATPQLDSLAMILQRIKVYTKEEDTHRTATYKDLLSGSQFFTLWLPMNGTYNAKSYLDRLDEIDALAAAGNQTEANALEYSLGVQFAQNHMARFNYESNKAEQEVRLYNGKLTTYNAGAGLFNGVTLNETLTDIPSSNGIIHVLNGLSPFAYNIFDYMEANADIFQNVYGTLSDPAIDKKVFSEASSTPGGMNSNGEMIYIDSVFVSDNELLNNSGAQIRNEDSLYIAIIPTDAAWADAYERVSKLFNYGSTYNHDYANNRMQFSSEYTANADSLKDYNTKYQLITSMYFSPSIFPVEFERTQTDEIIQYAEHADSLISTNQVIYYNTAGAGNKNPIFGDVEPVIASNGIIYPLTSYNVDPAYSFMTDQEVDMVNYSAVGSTNNCASGSQGTYYNLVEGSNWDESIDISMLETKGYRYFSASGGLDIYIPVRNLYSGKYRIRIQMVPTRVDTNHKWWETVEDSTVEVVEQDVRFYARLYDDLGEQIGENSEDVNVNDSLVQTYTLWESIDVPKCYVNLPSGVDNSFPILRLSMPNNYQPQRRKYTYALSIVKIFIDPVRDDEAAETN